ncbi:MAG TPA: helix-turn-helix domain-containing protein [Solirubrobacteraceae bacterium]|jgi:transposase|nr:helix-turn-helix domain-containing protein [Solirubrobacteraceae bacterium]
MDRASLEQLLGQGLSLAEIGRRLDRHEATVSYWVKKHGLEAANRDKHTARGGIARERLEVLIEADLSVAQIAEAVGRSKATVRHWLIRYGMKTRRGPGRRPAGQAQAAEQAGLATVTMTCARHGNTGFCLNTRGYYRCKRCRSEAVARRRRKMKTILVEEAGGACCICGYRRTMRALHFHHVEPSQKRHELNARGVALALDSLRAEARKCVLLCSNCHAEVEDGLVSVPADALERQAPPG